MRAYLRENIRWAIEQLDGAPADFDVEVEEPAQPDHGDLATNAAMQLAGILGRNPRAIAEEIVANLKPRLGDDIIASVEIAGPGFINFRMARAYLYRQVKEILEQGHSYGKSDAGEGQTALVEFVSANPTGPLTVGHGRNAVLGDTLANVLEWVGYDVTREYYFNDAGRQMRILARSVQARYRSLADPSEGTRSISVNGETVDVPASFPDDGYLGTYIVDIAQDLYEQYGDELLEDTDLDVFKRAAEEAIFEEIEHTLDRIGVQMDAYFNEHELYESDAIWEVVERLDRAGYVYEKEGATWLKTTEFGKDKDTVLVKSSGEPTYRLPDIAYHVDKIERGFDKIIDVFGADHVDTIPDVINAVECLGYDTSGIEVVLYQFVTLVRSGEPVKMSTRRATYVTLDDLVDEVGADVTRFFFLMRSPNTHLDFDLDRAKEAGEKNPVFYLQYAHARICSIIRKADDVDVDFETEADLELLTHEAEIDLIKALLDFPNVLKKVADGREPHWLISYLNDLATSFTMFYDHCRILGEDEDLATARMELAKAARIVLRNGLTVLGIRAPEQM